MRGTALLACLSLLAVSGCSSLAARPTAPAAMEVPAAWSAADDFQMSTDASTLVHWWSRFDDLLLSDLVEQALAANTGVTSARAALRQARALRDVAAAGLYPALGASASAQRNTTDSKGSNRFIVGLDASWEPDIFGATRSAVDAGDATVRASTASLGDVRISIAAEVALGYITLRGAQMRLAIAEDNLASQLETLQITQWRLQAGLVSSLEAEQACAAAEQTRAQLPLLRTSIEQSQHALAVLTGQPPAALALTLAIPAPVPQAADDLSLSIPAETLRQRPDVRAAEHQVSAAMARVAQADAARLPSFKLSGSLGLNALTLGSLTSGVVSTLLAGVSMPVFDGGAARAQVDAQEAALDQAQAAYRATVLTALKDVENALVSLRGDRERLLRLERAAVAAANAALLARQSFNSGLVDFQVVLETQRTQLNTQDSVASVRADLGADHVRLYKALGGGWDPDGAEPPIEIANRTDPK